MEARNCNRCGKVFNYINSLSCPDCEKKEERIFQGVKDYINEHESCSMGELSKSTGVSPKKILKYIREGRLEISKGMHGEVACDSCGKPITRGRYCDSCVIKLNQKVTDVFSEKKETGPRVHIRTKKL